MFFSGAVTVGFLMLALQQRRLWLRLIFYACALVALIPGPYLTENYFDIIRSGSIASATDRYLVVAIVIVVLIMVRAYVGWAMVIIIGVALAYAYFGFLIPGTYGHAGYSTGRIASHLLLSTEGLFGIPMGVAATYIFLFSLLGVLLIKTGMGEVFVQLAYALTGRVQGGPALTAVVSSAFVSSINGSAVANVVTTGTFTIPLMKRTGYRPEVAGGIEAAASSAGQITPPIMGAAAFLMAEFTGIPYREIAIAALVPALLYIFAMLVSVRLEAGRENLSRLDAREVPSVWPVLTRKGYMLLPFFVLIGLLFWGFTPTKAAVYAIVLTYALSLLRRETRIGLWGLVEVAVETLKVIMIVIAAVAAAGILIGMLTLTGLGPKLSGLILAAGGDNLLLVLLITMVASFVLGLGMPTSIAYLLLATLIAPALVEFGVPILGAHLFIFYYGLLSAITPPVAVAAYAGASIAQAGPNQTAMQAIRLGFVKVFVPFLFIYAPGILLLGTVGEIVQHVGFAFAATFALAVAFSGWLVVPLSPRWRLTFVGASILLVLPVLSPDLEVLRLALRGAGLALLVGAVVVLRGQGTSTPRQPV